MLSRGGWALSALAALSVGLLAPGALTAVSDLRGSSFPDALLALASLVQLSISSWVVLTVVLSLAHAPAPLLRAIAPRILRRALFAGTAGALALAPAYADRAEAPNQPPAHDLAGLRVPDRPTAATPHTASRQGPVVVRAGDTLWAIAARSLPAGSPNADITRACARWHDANRDVIGDDPNLIFPTQRLVPPSGKDPS